MKNRNISLFLIPSIVLAMLFTFKPALAQDPAVVAPNIYKVLLDNERVRISEVKFKPGDKVGTHSHPDHAIYVMSAGTLQMIGADGKKKDVTVKVGDVIWAPAETHQTNNLGTTEVDLLVVELKEPAKAPTAAASK
jgi:quercetin dioxygenase-like cupin family protein